MTIEAATPRTPVNLDDIKDLDQAWRVAQLLAQSDLVPVSLRGKPANVLLVGMTGRELGLSFAQAVRTIYVPANGMPQLRGSLLLAKLREAGHDYEWEYSEDGNACTFHVERKGGKKYQATFSLDDAFAAGLVKQAPDGSYVALSRDNKPLPWMQYRQDMLFWRAVARAVNRAVPEVIMGFEVMDHSPVHNEPVGLKPAARPAADEGPQPGGSPGEDAAAELAGLDARGAAASPGEEPAREVTSTPSAPARPEGLIEGSGRMVDPKALPTGQVTPGQRAKQQLSEKFNQLGWTFGEDKGEILGALTAFTRRVIVMPGNLTTKEATAISAQLSKILATTEPDHYLVALSDAIDGWEHDWQDADPESYERDYLHAFAAGRN